MKETGLDKLDAYASGVRSGDIAVCKWVRLAVERHYSDLRKSKDKDYPYYFEPDAAQHFFDFCGTLSHYEGIFSTRPLELEPWQQFVYGSIFGWLKKKKFRNSSFSDVPIRRFRDGVIFVPKKNGKALAIDTDIPTPNGFRKMKDIQKGDRVFDRNGNPCKVVAVTGIMNDRQCYRIYFSDGNTIIADEKHQWSTSSHIFRENKNRSETHSESIRTTKEIHDTVLVERCKKESYKYTHRNHRINKNPCVEYTKKNLPIDPYVFGLWLGDGCSNNASITIGHQDLKTVDRIKEAGYEVTERRTTNENSELFGIGGNKPDGVCNRGHKKDEFWNPNGGGAGAGKCGACDKLTSRARRNGDDIPETIYKTTNEILSDIDVKNNKHIPKDYLYSSKNQRLELLRGLMDSDGYCSKAGQCEFTSTNKRLATNTLELIRSLGIKAMIGEGDAKINGRIVSKKYRIHFYAYNDVPVFKLKRKAGRQKSPPTRKTRTSYRQIVNVEKVDSVPVKCIQVDSPDNMYLCGKGFIETHNSIMSGAVGLYMLEWDNWPGAQCYTLAKNQTHAKDLAYRAAEIMVENSPDLSKKFRVNRSAGGMGIYNDEDNSFYKAITSKPESEDGRNVHFCGPDETKDWTDFDIYEVMKNGTVNAPNSLFMSTTTAGNDKDSLGYEQQQYIEKLLSGVYEDDSTFGIIYTIDEEDKEKDEWWADPEVWKKANPNFGVSVFEDALKSMIPAAKRSINKKIAFETKHLNIWHSSSEAYITTDKWKKCGQKKFKDLEEYRGKRAWGGLDLGSVDDFTAFVLVIEGEKWQVVPMFWIPHDTVADRKNSSVIKGMMKWIETTPGNVTHHDYIEDQIKKCAEIVSLQEIAYDRYKMDQMVNHLMDEGIEMTPFGQGYVSMSPAVDCLETAVLEGSMEHFNNPVLEWMISNVTIKKDPAGNRKFDKEKSQDKIDGVVALSMALARAEFGEPEQLTDGDLFVV